MSHFSDTCCCQQHVQTLVFQAYNTGKPHEKHKTLVITDVSDIKAFPVLERIVLNVSETVVTNVLKTFVTS